MSLQSFFESTAGHVVIICTILILFFGILISGRKKQVDTSVMVASAILVALGIVLNEVTLFRMPQGGSVTAFSMLPVALCGYFFGVRRGVMAGMCVGLITLILNPYVVHPVQLVMDYPLAFGALGFAGFFREKKWGMITGYVTGAVCRCFCSIVSGVVFFGSYAPDGTNVWLYSIIYNGTYAGAEVLITVALLAVPQVRRGLERVRKTTGVRIAA